MSCAHLINSKNFQNYLFLQGAIFAGSDAVFATLTWAVTLLLKHKEMLQRAQQELDIHIGKERWAEESDIKNLIYIQAIIKETLR